MSSADSSHRSHAARSRLRSRAWPAPLATPLTLTLTLACAEPTPAPPPPDVILLVIDTLRADRLSCYGYDRPTSPFLDELAAGGALFEDHTTQFAWTVPSMVSLFTGRYLPREHHEIPADAVTLAELFQSAGYRTVGVVANELLHESSGFDRGFDHYDVAEIPPVEGQVQPFDELITRVWQPLAEALETDAAGRRPPVLLYLHALDPHHPYRSWPELEDELPSDGAAPLAPEGWHRERLAAAGTRRTTDEQDLAFRAISRERGHYDQEVRALDERLRGMFERLDALGLLERAVVAVCSDHGEGLWDHLTPKQEQYRQHIRVDNFFYQVHGRTLHQEILATPWILWGAGVPAGTRVRRSTENVDVLPTLLDLCGIPAPMQALHGRSTVPLLDGDASQWRRYVFSAAVRGRASVREVDTGLKLLLNRGALDGQETLPCELYDLSADPLERRDLSLERPGDVERLRALALDWYAEHRLPDGVEGLEPRPEFLERLRELGYTSEDTGFDE